MLVSKPIVSSRIYRTFSLVIMKRSSRKALPVIKEGEIKAGRSAYNEQSVSVENFLAMEFRTEPCLQVYLLYSRYSLQLEKCVAKFQSEGKRSMLMIERWTTLRGFFELPMYLLSISEKI